MKFYLTLHESYKQAKNQQQPTFSGRNCKRAATENKNVIAITHLITCLKSLQQRRTSQQVTTTFQNINSLYKRRKDFDC